MGSTSFDKVFIGSAVDAAAAETTTDITDQKADLTVKANAMGGEATVDYLEKEVIFSFHSVKNDSKQMVPLPLHLFQFRLLQSH